MMLIRILILSIILSMANLCHTQNFVWNKVYGGIQKQHDAINHPIIHSKSKDYIYILVNSNNYNNLASCELKVIDTTLIKNQINTDWILKLDTTGNLIWGKAVCEPNGLRIKSFGLDSLDNLYLITEIRNKNDSMRIFNNTPWMKLNSNEYVKTYISKINSDGDFLWQKSYKNILSFMNNNFKIIEGNIYFPVRKLINTEVVLNSDTIKSEYFLLNIDTSGNILSFFEFGKGTKISNYHIFKENDSLVIFLHGIGDSIILNNYNYHFNNKGYLIKILLNFNNLKEYRVISFLQNSFDASRITLNSVCKLSNGKFALSGSFIDTLIFNNNIKLIANNSKSIFIPFIVIVDNNKAIRAFQFSSPFKDVAGQFLISRENNGFIYLIGNITGSIDINGDTLTKKNGLIMVCKIDTLFNILWFIRTGDSVKLFYSYGFAFDKNNALYFATFFENNIILGNKNYISTNNDRDFILSKIYDYSITRGKVSKGPYCAGDSILIPFTKEGNFSPSNEFIAELSDENGNFDGNHRQLGKIKSNKDSFIKAALPLFDVVSSPYYRIRIISTSPQVQSYYRTDTLRLLIYSKDTANAGNDTTLCYNNSLNLKTSGGTKWRWSPGNLVTDSSARVTNTLPLTETTTFRIIISDSSGCGKTDTAYKTITVLTPINIDSANATIELCKGDLVNFNLSAKGGLGTYDFKWKLIDSTQWINSFQIPISGNGNYVYLVKADDGCSPSSTTQISSFTFSMPKISLPKDTLVCPLHTTILKLIYQKDVFGQTQIGGKSPYTFNWRAVNSNIFSLSDSIINTFKIPDTVYASITDKCGNSDTASIEVLLEKPLAAQIIQDQLCFEDTAFLHLKPDAIRKNKYIYEWFKNGNLISNDSAIDYSTKNISTTLIAKLSDNCNESVFDTITLFPQIIADLNISKLSVCEDNNEFIFKNQSLINDKKLTQFDWSYSNEFTPTIKDSSTLKGSFSKAGDYTINYQVESNSACVSKDSATVTVYPKPPINISWQRTTNTFDVSQWRFNATSSFSLNNILWDFGALGSGSGSPFFKTFYNSDTVKAKVKITDVLGCSNDTLFQFYLIHRKQFFIPNAITCNNDGINDVFIIDGAEWMKEFDLKIFNRWGEMVFKTNNPLEPWIPDDKSNNLYIYTLSIFDVYNERHILKGVVEVIR